MKKEMLAEVLEGNGKNPKFKVIIFGYEVETKCINNAFQNNSLSIILYEYIEIRITVLYLMMDLSELR
jgi:hypothetical protein